MKWYPFWKVWYLSREQRWGAIALISLIIMISLVKGPISNFYFNKQKQVIKQESELHWEILTAKIDSSKKLQKAIQDSIKLNKKTKINFSKKEQNQYNPPKKENIIIDINQADAETFKKLKGIGQVLSQRIVNYRSKLGGFYSTSQIREVYGIEDSLFQSIEKYLILKSPNFQKININTSDQIELEQHPYISKLLAKQIYNYRTKVKTFESIEEIKKIYSMNDSIYNKLQPYLTIY